MGELTKKIRKLVYIGRVVISAKWICIHSIKLEPKGVFDKAVFRWSFFSMLLPRILNISFHTT